jgi:hypothetical protein
MSVLDVRDFGPIGTPDDRPTIQAALDHAYTLADPAKTDVVIPPGLYWLRASLYLGSYTRVLAHGARLAWAKSQLESLCRLRNAGPVFGYEGEHDIALVGGIYDGNRRQITNTLVIAFSHARDIRLSGLHITGCYQHHLLEINASERVTLEDCELSDSTGSEAIQLDGAFGAQQYGDFGAYDLTPCREITIRRTVIHGVYDGIGSHTVRAASPHRLVHLEDVRIDCVSTGLKLRNYRDVTFAGAVDVTAATPVLWSESGRVMLSGGFTSPVGAAEPLPPALPELPPIPPVNPPAPPPPLEPPTGGPRPMHLAFYSRDNGPGTMANVPATLIESWASPIHRRQADLTGYTQARVSAYAHTAGSTGTRYLVRYSLDDGVTWAALDGSEGPWVTLDAVGFRVGAWFTITPAARVDVQLQSSTVGGNGTADPGLSGLYLECR